MKTANIGDLKNNLSKYLADVKRGGEVLVKERNAPIAKIVPFIYNEDDYDAEELDLIARGILRPPEDSTLLTDDFWEDDELPKVSLETVLRIIREERDED